MKTRHPLLQALFKAAANKEPLTQENIFTLKNILSTIAKLNSIRQQELTISEQFKKKIEGISFDVREEININEHNGKGNTALILAAVRGHLELVRELLNAKADPNIQGFYRGTPLTEAVAKNHYPICLELLSAKANVNVCTSDGMTPLMWAARQGEQEVLQLLINAKADPNVQGVQGSIAFLVALQENHDEIFHSLIAAKADLNIKAKKGRTALITVTDEGKNTLFSKLLEAKADVNIQDDDRNTALIRAVDKSHTELANKLIDAKADVNIQGFGKETALIWAAYLGNREIALRLIVEGRAELNATNAYGRSSLAEAIRMKQLSTCSLLLNYGAMIRESDVENLFSFLFYSGNCDQRHPDVLIAFNKLIERLNDLKIFSDHDKSISMTLQISTQLKLAENYVDKLIQLTKIYRKKIFEALQVGTNAKLLPELLNMIADYDAPLSRISPFYPEDIDFMFPKPPEESKKPEIKSQNARLFKSNRIHPESSVVQARKKSKCLVM